MASRRNAIKKIRADRMKRLRNVGMRSALHTFERRLDELIGKKEVSQAREFSKLLFSKIDKAIGKGIIKENAGNRKKSRLSKRLHLLAQTSR